MSVLDVTGCYICVNRALCELTGYSEEELLATNFQSIVYADDLKDSLARLHRLQAGPETNAVLEMRYRRRDGGTVWVRNNAASFTGDNGNVACFVTLSENIDEYKRAESARFSAEERFRVAATNSSDVIYEVDLNTGALVTFGSPGGPLGLPVEERLTSQTKALSSIHPGDRSRILQAYCRHLDTGAPFFEEHRIVRSSGQIRYLSHRGMALRTPEGVPYKWIGTASDITERKKTEEILSAVVETAPMIEILRDPEGHILLFNKAAEQISGYTREEVTGKDIFGLLFPAAYREEKARPYSTQGGVMIPGVVELPLLTKSGEQRQVEWRCTPVHLPSYEQPRVLAVGIDITDVRRIEQMRLRELQRAKEQAEASNLAKTRFLANISHEIRTPMNGIIGMAELALGTNLDSEQYEYVAAVRKSALHLLDVINDILDYSRIEAGRTDLRLEPFSIREMLNDAVESVGSLAREKQLRLTCQVSPRLADRWIGDAVRIRQIVLNLLGNAIKFTDAGKVGIRAGGIKELEPGGLCIAVRDTGIGISKDKQQQIFDPFVQADASSSRRFEGTGLGLSICRRLVELMNGRLWVDSAPGVGSTFYFTLPLRPDESDAGTCNTAVLPAERPVDTEVSVSGRVLVVEDNVINQRVAIRLLEKAGLSVSVASNGSEALEQLDREFFDLVLMDVQMPEMNGYETTQAIRSREKAIREGGMAVQPGSSFHAARRGDRPIPIVAITAHAMPSDWETCIAAGMNDYLAKPIESRALMRVVSKWLRWGGGSPPAISTGSISV
ncbi:MAG: PAS domain S-box protein [Bryobacteraceae bacterium]|nr:PAS domain S-box protein [Bryobacteraceae bacterium]